MRREKWSSWGNGACGVDEGRGGANKSDELIRHRSGIREPRGASADSALNDGNTRGSCIAVGLGELYYKLLVALKGG
jgi:hypothetical protein